MTQKRLQTETEETSKPVVSDEFMNVHSKYFPHSKNFNQLNKYRLQVILRSIKINSK